MSGYIDSILGLSSLYFYPSFFVTYIFLGGVILIPALYFSAIGKISMVGLFIVVIACSAFVDSFWYFVGNTFKKERILQHRFFLKRIKKAEKFSNAFSRNGIFFVFITKFIYGTRLASHLLAGIHKLPYFKFLISTTIGSILWFLLMLGLIKIFDLGVTATGNVTTKIQFVFLGMAISLIFINLIFGRYFRNKLLKK